VNSNKIAIIIGGKTMKKSTKLLSVILAVIMILSSLTVGAFAAKTSYKTVANLNSLSAYSPYGTVTRLTTEERMSILLDWLDNVLTDKNINMGEVFNMMGLSITIDLRSVNAICSSVDTFKNTMDNGLYSVAAGILNFGIIEDVSLSSWSTGMSREGKDQLTIISTLLQVLVDNSGVINTVLTSGIDLGLIGAFLKGVDLKPINKIVTNIPGFAYSKLYPLMTRSDDTNSTLNTYQTRISGSAANLVTTVNDFVKGLFTKPMKWTSYRVDAATNGNSTGATLALPTAAKKTARYFAFNDNKTVIAQYDYDYEKSDWAKTVEYTIDEEYPGAGVWLYRAPADYAGDQTLKWYTAGDEGYWLPGLRDAFNSNAVSINVNGAMSVLDIVYKFAPYLFNEMAVVVLNGSVKKLVAQLFGVEFSYIGDQGDFSEAVPNDAFFTKAQEPYVWEYSDYKVIDGVPYYRFEDQYFVGKLPKYLSSYYYMFDWNYSISEGWVDEFIPVDDSTNSSLGYSRILYSLNDFVAKAINTFILPTWEVKGVQYSRSDIFAWTTGDLDHLAQNILNVARKVFMIAPEEIIDEYYAEAQFYDAMMHGTLQQAVNGLVCEVVKLLMPQIVWPDNVIDQDMISIAAIVVRELITDLMPSYDFDALIYSSYDHRALIEGKDKAYWTNVTLTMGVDLGMYYLRNLADLGEDTSSSYYKVMKTQGALPTDNAETQVYAADYDVSQWLKKVDWVIDWALSTEEWGWRMQKLVGTNAALTTYEDPWNKLNTILLKILPLDQLLNQSNGGYNTFLQNILQGKLVNAVSNVDFKTLVSIFDIPSGYFTENNILDQAVKLVVRILNGVTNTVLNNAAIINANTVNSAETLLSQANIRTVAVNLVSKLMVLYNRGLLDIAMPFVTLFLGWKADPQVFADPKLSFENSEGYAYYYTSGTETLKVRNDASGMLLKHRNSNITDTAYTIKITSLTSNDGTVTTTTSLPVTVAPWETGNLTLKNTSTTARAVQITIGYTVTGKDGAALGGTQYSTITTYVSSQTPSTATQAQLGSYTAGSVFNRQVNFVVEAHSTLEFVGSASEIDNFSISFKNEATHDNWIRSHSSKTAPTSPLVWNTSEYVHGTNKVNSMADSDHGFMNAQQNALLGAVKAPGYMFVKFVKVSNPDALVSGTAYNGGVCTVNVGNAGNGATTGNITVPTFYYYDFADMDDLFYKCETVGKVNLTGEYTSAYNTFLNALKDCAELIYGPKQSGTFASKFSVSRITTLTNNLQRAYDALVNGGFFAEADYNTQRAKLQNQLDICEDRANGEDYDFADHALFEYFKYENERTATREMMKALTAPEAPQNYIEGESLSAAQIADIIAAQSNENIKTGINNTVITPSQSQMDEYNATLSAWAPASYSDIAVDDQVAKLPYYKQFMTANARDITASYQKTFINREISYAQAQNYVAADYTADTWKAYTDALANAQQVAAAESLPSEIFDAKYELMIAQHNLLKQDRSMKEDGENYLDSELTGLIANAEIILNNLNYYDVVDGMTQADALGQLVKALGVRYELDGNDAILYDHSAYTFIDYDRVDSAKNRLRVDEAAEKLQNAINNFVCNVVLESTDTNVISDIVTDVKLIKGILPGAINSLEGLESYVTSIDGTTREAIASAAGLFGTGAKVNLYVNAISTESPVAIYVVLIYGDVNGDGAIDAFDMFNVDMAQYCGLVLDGMYFTAADISGDDSINLADYTAIRSELVTPGSIDQTL
jgi:hypothetical protein